MAGGGGEQQGGGGCGGPGGWDRARGDLSGGGRDPVGAVVRTRGTLASTGD